MGMCYVFRSIDGKEGHFELAKRLAEEHDLEISSHFFSLDIVYPPRDEWEDFKFKMLYTFHPFLHELVIEGNDINEVLRHVRLQSLVWYVPEDRFSEEDVLSCIKKTSDSVVIHTKTITQHAFELLVDVYTSFRSRKPKVEIRTKTSINVETTLPYQLRSKTHIRLTN